MKKFLLRLCIVLSAVLLLLLVSCAEEQDPPAATMSEASLQEMENTSADTSDEYGDLPAESSAPSSGTGEDQPAQPEPNNSAHPEDSREEIPSEDSWWEESGELSSDSYPPEDYGPPATVDPCGREINILCAEFLSVAGLPYTGEVITDSEASFGRLDIAKQTVIDQIEAEYGVTINGEVIESHQVYDRVVNMVLAGVYEYDLIFANSRTAQNLLSNGLLTDLNSVSTIHLEQPWWDQNAVKELSIGGKLFWICGDINTQDNMSTMCVLFNKDLKEELEIQTDFYRLVKEGLWNMDTFMEICQGVTEDLNGDGLDEHDRWAVGTEKFHIYTHLAGGGIPIAGKAESDDLPYLTLDMGTDSTYKGLQKILGFYNGNEVMVANGGKYNHYANPWEATVMKAFTEGRELFYICSINQVIPFRNMEDEFGILPIPKLYAEQDRYYSTASPDYSSYMMIPYGVPEVEELGVVVEALAMNSRQWVTGEFYEVLLRFRDARDEDSREMLDIIFENRFFDLGLSYNWGNISSCYTNLDAESMETRFDGVLGAAQQALSQTVDRLTELELVN